MDKKQDNTELIAFRVSKSLKRRLDSYCKDKGIGIAAYFRCVILNLPDCEIATEQQQREEGQAT